MSKNAPVDPSASRYVASAVTVSVNDCVALCESSATSTVMTVVPACPRSGVAVNVRSVPAPPMTMFASGSSAAFDERAVTTRSAASVSASSTVKPVGPSTELRLMV